MPFIPSSFVPIAPKRRWAAAGVTGVGRPFGPAVVAAVRAWVEHSDLTYREIAARTGVSPSSACGWRRLHGWRRPAGAPAAMAARPGKRQRSQALWRRAQHLAERCLGDLEQQAPPDPVAIATALALVKRAKLAQRSRLFGSGLAVRRARARAGGCGPGGGRVSEEWVIRLLPPLPLRRKEPCPDAVVALARSLVEDTDLPAAAIARAAEIHVGTVYRWATNRGWVRRFGSGFGAEILPLPDGRRPRGWITRHQTLADAERGLAVLERRARIDLPALGAAMDALDAATRPADWRDRTSRRPTR